MAENEVLLFPSLLEGFGLVILEAMAQGMAVITTTNTGGADVLENGRNGFVVPIRDVEALCEALNSLADDRDYLFEVRREALKASQALQWSNYRKRLNDIFASIRE